MHEGWSTPNIGYKQNVKDLFEAHYSTLKAHYCGEKTVGAVGSPPFMDMHALNHQSNMFKGPMMANVVDAMQLPITLNPFTKLCAHSCNVEGSKEQLPSMVSKCQNSWRSMCLNLLDSVLLKIKILQPAVRSPCNMSWDL